MIIAHNVVDLNAFNKFYKNNKSASSSLEKVASGLRIVKANDDAAGLAISEKMRAQIRGIDMAIRNSQDGISLIQTAESGMSEVHSLVQRMRELTIQGANDTLNNEDRNAIQVELNQLKSEINNIASNTEFNNIKLLDGSIIGKSYSTVTKNITITPNIGIPDDGTEVNANLNVEGVDLKILFTNSGTNKVNISVKSGETTLGMANAVGTVAEIAPTIEWQKSLGDINSDYGMNIKQTTDGGYIVSGTNGAHDYEIIKLDSNGNTSWTKTLGGAGSDAPYSIKQSTDGGYIIVGYKNDDAYLTKLDSNGNIQYDKLISTVSTYTNIQQTSDGGYILSGNDANDASIMKLDSNGNVVWEKKYGGTATDDARMIQQTSDGGFIFTGRTHSPEIDGYHNETYPILYSDVYVAKIDSLGNLEWQRALGGSAQDDAGAIQQTSDGGYMIIGATESNNGDITFNHGSNDIWLIKLSSTGNIEWEKTYGGSEYDWAYDFNKTSDGGFIISGTTISRDGDVSYRVDSYVEDVWILKLDSSGNIKWNKTYGGSNNDWTSKFGEGVQQTSDGGFIFIATSTSNDGDVSENHGGSDMWIVKLNPPGTDSSLPVTASVAINEIQSEGKRIKFEDAKITFNNSGSVTVDKIELKAEIVDTNVKGEGLVLQVGPNAGQIMHIPIDSVKPVDLGLIDGIPDVTTSTAASSSLAYVDEAMQKVSTGRSRLGSKYNALEHIISNLNNSSENLTAAESRIRDADIAEEMMNLTKNNILSEAAQAIMSQANQVPQRVLDLIQK